MNRRFLGFLLVLLIGLFGLVACSSTDDSSKDANNEEQETNNEGDSQDEITLNITWWGSQTRHDSTQQVLDLYMEQNPHVTFETTPSGWDGYFDKLSAQAAGGSMPDIIQMDYSYIATFSDNGVLADLQPFVDNGTLDMSNVDANLVDSGKVNNELTGAVVSSSAIAVTYNPEVFEQAGVEEPTSEWTWEDFKSDLLQIQSETGVYGTAKITDMHNFSLWVRQHGKSLFAEDGTKLGYEDDQIFVDYLNLLKELEENDALPNPDEWAQISSKGKEAEPVVTGEGATTFDWSNFAVITEEANPNLKLMTPSQKAGGENGLWIKPGMFWSVAESSKHQEEATKFINWFNNSEEANDIIKAERGIPVSSEIRDYLKPQLSEQSQKMFDYIDLAAENATSIDPPEPAGVSEVQQLFNDTVDKTLYGQIDVETAASNFRSEANNILSRN
ncbi:multiple sugar transport system substrate-binding protein [Gracilibacillus orientalis]|uniref:Multiple sugar transport system substrate-binding protein n=1 Tax=Gracilibacillus orientalis TaxID=334253 RepID=A0A1I4N8E6_9BACI|nr:extracellular solute-binding protein [Gracilibacillus orientalis]SFM11616.1 multiple sugar transport system substrate-binding protein [Gracilibacillus orientalis]